MFKYILKDLNKFQVKDNIFERNNCFLCNNNIKINELIIILLCKHLIHSKCLKTHIVFNDNFLCKICDKEIITKECVNKYIEYLQTNKNLDSNKSLNKLNSNKSINVNNN